MKRLSQGRAALKCIFWVLLLFAHSAAGWAQCSAGHAVDSQIQRLFQQHNWTEVVRLAPLASRSADSDFYYGLALAQLHRWHAARAALLDGARQCPRQKRFPIELAGVAFEQKRYPEAAVWLRRGLKLDPKDAYANNFAGTVYFLMGNLPAALKYWNRVHKPYIAALNFDPHLRVHRQLLDRSFAFSPAGELLFPQLLATEERLEALNIFPTYNIVLSARADGNFDADFHAIERNGFGSSRLQALASTFGGAAYETIYPSYYNIGRSAANFESLLRWDSQKRRAWLSLSSPFHALPQQRWQISTDLRDENWVIRRSSTGPAPPLGALNLRWQLITASLHTLAGGRLQWSTGAELSHRNYRDVTYGSALTPQLLSTGYSLKYLASVDYKLLEVPERRFSLDLGASSQTARIWSNPPHLFEKLQGSALAHWYPQAAGDKYEAEQRVRAGGTFGTAPFDQLFMLGVERDNDLWLRGQVGTRDGRKGSAPLGYNYFLSNTDFYRRIFGNGLFTVKLGPLFDIGKMDAPVNGLSTRQWLFDTGIEAKVTVLGTGIVFTYGRDLRSGNNAFFGTLAQTQMSHSF